MNTEQSKITVEPIEPFPSDIATRASSAIIILPTNWPEPEGELVYAGSTESVKKLLRREAIPVETLTPVDASTHLRDERALDWVSPTLVVSGLLTTQNAMAVDVALNIISSYVTDLFKGVKKDPNVKLTIIQTRSESETAQKLLYQGPVSGLPEISRMLAKLRGQGHPDED